VAGTLSPERPHISHQPINRSLPSGRAIIDRQTTQVEDISVYGDEFPGVAAAYRKLGVRTILATPLLREGNSIGVVLGRRTTVRPFTDQQIALLHTFADQAVIAIENVRLFKELQTSNRELTTALEQQTATSDILRVISGSPTDIQPVFDAILKRAATLCEAQLAHLWLYEGGEQFRLGAGYGSRPDHLEWLQQGLHRFGQPFFRESGPGRVGQVLAVRDTEPYRRGDPLWVRTADHEGMRTLLGVPLVKDGRLVGSIAVYRREVQPFTDQQTALVQTFADQAVIAIENVRLFNETKEALEQQTATSEILRVISRSPTDLQPVFDSIAASALRLCDAKLCTTFRFDGELIHLVGSRHVSEEGADAYRDAYPSRPGRQGGTHRAILTRTIVHIPDIREDAEYELRALARANDYGCVLSVPMLRDGHPVGAITVGREAARPFTNAQIELLKTFADQAVIAIE